MANLSALPPPRWHNMGEMDITLVRLYHAGEVCLQMARAYRDHCAKVAWTTAFASLQKAGCGHVDALNTYSMAVVTAKEVAARRRRQATSSSRNLGSA